MNQLGMEPNNKYESFTVKPFLKWAGGKTQLINEIKQRLPKDFEKSTYTYIEPFIGSGAILLWMISNYPNIEKAVINDINYDLINTYKVVSTHPGELISILGIMQSEYHSLDTQQDKKKEYYYNKRESYNLRKSDIITQAALFIFLNRTCFNGLYRVNKSNEFNVPMGSYQKPTICDEKNLLAVNKVLQKVEILNGDYERTLEHAGENSFFYFDPPYKPLNTTSSFNSYAKDEFNDQQQVRLRDFCSKIDSMGYQWMLSNSDVKGVDENNPFFDELYAEFNIERVKATRRINSKADKRGELNELLITNYSY